MDGRKLLEALIEDVNERQAAGIRDCPSRQILERIASLSVRGFGRFLDTAQRQIRVRYDSKRITIEIDTDAWRRILDSHAEEILVMDDVDKLVMFGAPRSVIRDVTGAHHMCVTARRRSLGVDAKSGKPRALSEDEEAAVREVWQSLAVLNLADRLIMASRITGLSIGNLWPLLQVEELLEGPTGAEGRRPHNGKAYDGLSEPRPQYGPV